MRKHFLILMLMALLPLAGFAEDLSQGKMVIPSTYYGYAPSETTIKVYNKANVELTSGTHYTFDGIFDNEEGTGTPLTAAQIAATVAGTKLYVKVTGKDTYENSLTSSFEIKKMPLLLKGNAGTKVYGTSADGTLYTITDVIENITGGVSLTGAGKVFNTPNSKISFTRATGENVGNKELTATITESLAGNFIIANADIKNADASARAYYTITAKDFVAEGVDATVTITINDDDLTYTGYAQQPAYVVKDKASGATLVENKDYTVVYKSVGDVDDACITAGNHDIRFTGKGNYDTADKVQMTFEIDPAIIMVRPIATKEYNGAEALPDAPATAADNVTAQAPAGSGCYFKFQGFVGGSSAADVTFGIGPDAPAWTWNVAADETADQGTYDLKIKNDDVNDAFTLANYTFMAQKGTYTITKKAVTAAAKDDDLNYGETKVFTLKTDDAEALAGAVAGDYTALRRAIKVVKSDEKSTVVGHEDDYELTPEWKSDDEITADINADAGIDAADKADAIAAAIAAKGNYDMTPAKGYLTFNKADLVIALDESKYTLTKVYDGQPISVALDKENGLIISGLVNEEDINDINLTNLALNVVGTNNGNWKATPYVLKLSGATAEFYDITYVASSYTITKRPLNITTFDQTLVKGQAYNLNQDAYKITNTAANEGLVDDATKVFKLSTAIVTGGTPAVITSDAGDYPIDAVDVEGTASKWANYEVVVVKGNAEVIEGTVITFSDDKDSKAELTAAATAATPTTISFSARNLTPGVWNVLVLPFDITVAEFSEEVGYAVVNMFDQTANDGKVHFNLHMGNIPANTPFMFKVNDEYNNLNQIYFGGQTIIYEPTATVAREGVLYKANGNPYVHDAFGNELVGFYGKKTDDANLVAAGEYYLNTSGNWRNSDGTVHRGSARAKLVLATNAREILVQEPDGSVTAISCITADGVAVEADGWYTLNGVKLQGAPTEKGIYIRNGKKMVIK